MPIVIDSDWPGTSVLGAFHENLTTQSPAFPAPPYCPVWFQSAVPLVPELLIVSAPSCASVTWVFAGSSTKVPALAEACVDVVVDARRRATSSPPEADSPCHSSWTPAQGRSSVAVVTGREPLKCSTIVSTPCAPCFPPP